CLIHELVDINRAGGFQGDVLEFFLADLDEGLLVERIALDDVFIGHFFACVGVDLHVSDAMARLLVELVERYLLALRDSWIERDRTGDERQTQEAFPVGARGHVRGTPFKGAAWIQDERALLVPTNVAHPERKFFKPPTRLFCSCYVLIEP